MSIGVFIRTLREEMRYTQQELAEAAGVSRSWISRVEMGEIVQPDAQLLRALAKPLRRLPEELLVKAGYLEEGERGPKDLTVAEILQQIDYLNNQLKRKLIDPDGDREPLRSGRSGTLTLERPRRAS